jgi:aconitate hydratase
MSSNVTQKLIRAHLLHGDMKAGDEIGIRIDQTLTQDATGTLVMLELEALDLERVKTEISVQYVDHNIVQADFKNADDHLFLRSACQRFGVWFSGPGNGVSHPCHQENFGKPEKTLLGADSHTPAGGALGMLAIGAGGLEVALAMAGEPFFTPMPYVWGVKLVGRLPDWVSAKDVILEMLRRHGVESGVGKIVEYYGPGLATLSAMDRHVIANMGAELGATTTVFPSDHEVRRFLRAWRREDDWVELVADPCADYDLHDEIDLSSLEPLIAMPSSPGHVRPVREVAGEPIYQAYVGSSANPGYRDFAVSATMVRGRRVHERVSFDVSPTSRAQLESLMRDGHIADLIHVGARLHQAGCNGCIGMGQAPATNALSLRTVPRNFPGRSGTREDKVCLVSPETATASALTGVITDPRSLGIDYPRIADPDNPIVNRGMFVPPLPREASMGIAIEKGPNIASLPPFVSLSDTIEGPVLLKMGDDVSTDEIMPAGTRVLPFRSNIPRIAEFSFNMIDPTYAARAKQTPAHFVVGGNNYGQGSSREHAALGPQFLGLRAVVAKSFARIHAQNLVNFGVLPLTFVDAADYNSVQVGDVLRLAHVRRALAEKHELLVENVTRQRDFKVSHTLSHRQIQSVLSGGLINWTKARVSSSPTPGRA